MTNICYQITMGTGLALAIDGNSHQAGSQLILKTASTSDPDQLWSLVAYPATRGLILLNPYRGLYAAPASGDNGAAVQLFDLPENLTFDDAHTWEVASDSPYPVRIVGNNDQNLNAAGSDWQPISTPIIVWKWDSGLNEVWTFKPVKTG
ncbi:hypothetical protein FNL55_16725 [Tardiphaga sp. vice352]|uniref:RICIN domain-containing protein n=1 Tax=unclassified Tardiphaga TaxID=2631404 RepID=UPI0011642AB8|nr:MULTISPECIES: hypothetical protein [unclassified Tardiphaga]QDM17416.1 hypothetical protein FNL53_16825 [Tardiphaga sp. vice278]QDM22389.1 hypothetical protein FIU28_15430 [Tardiphaga sp. vice154]QDM27674.1 hypothetical protein FNL56_17240 [Tardiphaga sp. vice304]QDM32815.1 hypothetical protein FNL55_16725 [Tardiphaga sp. vice352]